MEANGKFKSLSFELFSMIGSNSIQSRGLVRYKGFPVKVYPFAEYFDKAYGTTEEALKEVSSLIANHSLVRRTVDSLPYLYGLAFPWADIEHGGPVRNVDFYSFLFDSEWNKCNPEWLPCIFEKGAIQLYNNKKGCGTGLIILGREEYLRRIVAVGGRGLDDYLQEWVDLGELGPIDSRIAKLEV